MQSMSVVQSSHSLANGTGPSESERSPRVVAQHKSYLRQQMEIFGFEPVLPRRSS